MKQPSPSTNPLIHSGLEITGSFTIGLLTATVFGNEVNKLSDSIPKFIEALIFIIFCNPLLVRCSFFKIKSITCLNSLKSAYFCFYPLVKNQRE